MPIGVNIRSAVNAANGLPATRDTMIADRL